MSQTKAIAPVDGTVLIALFSAGAYAIAFTYERAYITSFGLPSHLVEVDLKSILLAGAGIMGVVVVLNVLSLVLTLIPSSWPGVVQRRFAAGLTMPVLFAIMFALMGVNSKPWVNALLWAAMGLFVVIAYFGARHDMKKLEQEGSAYLEWIEKLDSRTSGPIWRWGENQIGFLGMRMLAIFGVLVWMVSMVGAAHARQKQWFLVPSDPTKQCVVVREYRSVTMCAITDSAFASLSGKYIFFPTTELERSYEIRLAGPFERPKR